MTTPADNEPMDAPLFTPAVLELAEEYEQQRNAGTAPSAVEFASRYPEVRDTLLRAIALFGHLHSAGVQTQDEQEFRRIVADATHLASLATDTTLDHFIIDREIGRGGMGIVYRASDDVLKRDVAIKVLNPNLLISAATAREVLSQFEHEARSTARLRHSEIMIVHGIYPWRTVFYTVMPFVDGRTWKQLALDWLSHTRGPILPSEAQAPSDATTLRELRPGNAIVSLPGSAAASVRHQLLLPVQRVSEPVADVRTEPGSTMKSPSSRRRTSLADWDMTSDRCHRPEFWTAFADSALRLARALEYAHHHEIMHRDIKPANVMMDARGSVQLMDFGLAWIRDRGKALEASVAGSRRYMSREQLQGRVSERSDVYGLGTTLLELAAAAEGRLPDETLIAVDGQGFHRRHPVAHSCRSCPPDLRAIIEKAIVNGIGDYDRASAFALDLQRFLDGAETTARAWSSGRKLRRYSEQHPLATFLTAALVLCLMIAIPSYLMTADALRKLEVANVDLRTANATTTHLAEDRAAALKQLESVNIDLTKSTEKASRAETAMRGRLQSLAIRDGLRGDATTLLSLSKAEYRSWDDEWLAAAAKPVYRLNSRYADGRWNVLATALSPSQRRLAVATADGLLSVWNCRTGLIERRLCEGRLHRSQDTAPSQLHYFQRRPEGTGPRDWSDDCCLAISWPDEVRLLAVMLRGTIVEFHRSADGTDVPETVFDAGAPLEFACFADDTHACLLTTTDGRTVIWSQSTGPRDVILPDLVSDAMLTAATFDARADAWFVGFSNGTIVTIPSQMPAVACSQVPGPVWSLDAQQSAGGRLVAVGCQDEALLILEESPTGRMDRLTRVPVPQSESNLVPLHIVRFSGELEDTLLAVDARSRFLRFSMSPRMEFESECGSGLPDPTLALVLLRDPGFSKSSERWPACFLRQANTLQPLGQEPYRHEPRASDPSAILIAGFDGLAGVYLDMSSVQQRFLKQRLITQTAAQPSLCADSTDPNRVWSLGANGLIRLIDVWSDEVVAEVQLPGNTGIGICHGRSDLIAAVSASTIHLLRLNGERTIEEVSQFATGLASPLKSFTSLEGTEDRPLLMAGVDHSGRLWIWSWSGSEIALLQSFAPLNDLPFPGSGRAAFSADGQWLIAGSLGQDMFVCEWNPGKRRFEQRPNRFPVAANGVEDVTFGRSVESGTSCLTIVDALDRVVVAERVGDQWVGSRTQDISQERDSRAVRLTQTRDHRRIVRLHQDGRIVFLLPPRPDSVATIRSSMTNCRDLCFSNDGSTLIIATADGRLERLSIRMAEEVEPRPADTITTLPARQLEGVLHLQPLPQSMDFPGSDIRLVLDAAGVCHAIVPERMNAESEPMSRLWSVRTDQAGHSLVSVPGSSCMDRIVARTVDLELGTSNGQLRMAFRCMPLESITGAYDGDVWFVEKDAAGLWTGERVVESHNSGFHCNLHSLADGSPVLFHYSFDGHQTLVQQRAANGEWLRSHAGPTGFGLSLSSAAMLSDDVLVAGKSHRFNGDCAMPRVYRWNSRTETPVPWPVHSKILHLIDGPPGVAGAVCHEADSCANEFKTLWKITRTGTVERLFEIPTCESGRDGLLLCEDDLLVAMTCDAHGQPGLVCTDSSGSRRLLLPGSLHGELLAARLRETGGHLMIGFALREAVSAANEFGSSSSRIVIAAITVPMAELKRGRH